MGEMEMVFLETVDGELVMSEFVPAIWRLLCELNPDNHNEPDEYMEMMRGQWNDEFAYGKVLSGKNPTIRPATGWHESTPAERAVQIAASYGIYDLFE